MVQTKCHVALIRGINVGKAKRVAMADLRTLLEGLGYANVRTLLNSGNVVFEMRGKASGSPSPKIEAAMTEKLGVSANITILTAAELAAIVAENPLGKIADNPSRLLVSVWRSSEDRARLEPLLKHEWDPEVIALGTRAAYLWLPDGLLQSKLSRALDQALEDRVTSRNWSTMKKLLALTQDD